MEHLEPKAAFEFLKRTADALFIDCRSEMEFLFVGHPVGALHVAWNDGPDWLVNPHFVGQVKRLAGTNHTTRPIVLICRSGNRSNEAGEELERAGFTRVYNVRHGFIHHNPASGEFTGATLSPAGASKACPGSSADAFRAGRAATPRAHGRGYPASVKPPLTLRICPVT